METREARWRDQGLILMILLGVLLGRLIAAFGISQSGLGRSS